VFITGCVSPKTYKMRIKAFFLLGLSTFLIITIFSCSREAEVIGFKVNSFNISEVRLLQGPFSKATKLNIDILLEYEPDRFLAKFRQEAGLEPRAEHYHGWEDMTIAGHSLGHYLTALCLMYETCGAEEFRERALYITDELELCQKEDGEGYIGAFPNGKRILEEEVARGEIKAKGFDLNGIWVPFYTQHKVMDGLLHVYRTFSCQKALEINVAFADWLHTIVKDLTNEQLQEMLGCEHGGINESLAELYSCTGNKKHLELSRTFHHQEILDPIIEGKDVLAGKHSNTQIPKFIGLARRYELTGDERDRTGAENFWNMIVHHHSYVTGGNGNHEYLGPPDELNYRLSDNTTETCNVYNMLKLSEHIFQWTADPEVMDFYERALLNHIRSSQHPQTGHVIYNLSLDMGGFKVYQDPEGFTCCVGSGMETHSKYSKNIYYHGDDDLYVVQFIASELTWKEKGVVITQQTAFPEADNMSFTIEADKPTIFSLNIRYPMWAENGIRIRVNGKDLSIKEEPGSFVKIHRKWKSGDRVELQLPFSLRIESMPDNPNRISVFHGPLVLAGDLGPVPDPNSMDPDYVPVLMTKDPDPSHWLSPVEGSINHYMTSEVAYPRQLELKPFYRTHDRHYSIFWDTFTDQEWRAYQKEYAMEQKRKNDLEQQTVDLFRIGEMQAERDHNFEEEKTWVGEFKSKKYREADRGGWFSFEMEVLSEGPLSLNVEYWGGYSGSKTFDILVEDQLIATENITNKAPGRFIDISYKIPVTLSRGKEKIKVTFQPNEGHRAGPVFAVRTLRDPAPNS